MISANFYLFLQPISSRANSPFAKAKITSGDCSPGHLDKDTGYVSERQPIIAVTCHKRASFETGQGLFPCQNL